MLAVLGIGGAIVIVKPGPFPALQSHLTPCPSTNYTVTPLVQLSSAPSLGSTYDPMERLIHLPQTFLDLVPLRLERLHLFLLCRIIWDSGLIEPVHTAPTKKTGWHISNQISGGVKGAVRILW